MRALGSADPATLAQQVAAMGGQEFFERWSDADDMPPPPPLVVILGMEWVEVRPSRVAIALEPAEWMFNPIGSIHGGIAATLLDTALGTAVSTLLPAGSSNATSDLHIRYLRAMTLDTGRVIATGTVVHAGRRHATAEGRVEVEATGQLIATATAGYALFQSPP
jgi:uncharacterized protein (TIGR00369 family)